MRVLLESNQFLSDISFEICSNDDWKSVVGVLTAYTCGLTSSSLSPSEFYSLLRQSSQDAVKEIEIDARLFGRL